MPEPVKKSINLNNPHLLHYQKNDFSSKSKESLSNLKVGEVTQNTLQTKLTLRDIQLPSKDRHMWKNLRKAMFDHGKEEIKIANIIQNILTDKPYIPLEFSCQSCAKKGKVRVSMEDYKFIQETKEELVFGVFDGHGGQEVAKLAAKNFNEKFIDELKSVNHDVEKAIQNIIDKTHAQVIEKGIEGGSTAVICYIDKKTNEFFVATLGDSEAILAQRKNNHIQTIECSRIINWSTPMEAKRAAEALGTPETEEYLIGLGGKKARFPFDTHGVNVSRAIGDQYYNLLLEDPTKEGVIQKINMTKGKLEDDCIFIAWSDGAGDYVSSRMLVKELLKPNWDKKDVDLSKLIVKYALKDCQSQDNVTAIVVRVKASKQ